MTQKRVLILLSISEMFALTLWFCMNAIIPQLETEWNLTNTGCALLSIAVQLGFVTGALTSSLFNIADIFKTKNVFVVSALTGSGLNLILILFVNSYFPALILRFLTGVSLAGVYPTGMKIMATWFSKKRGFAVAVLVAALTIGSGLPYIFNLINTPQWRILMFISIILSLFAAIIVYFFVMEGPYGAGTAGLEIKQVRRMLKQRSLTLANFGYFGHMWELYAMWIWTPVFLRDTYLKYYPGGDPTAFFSLGTFGVFFLGGLATIAGGRIADKKGRTYFNIAMLLTSGLCTLLTGLGYILNPYLALFIVIIWGITIIPDSPQYSVMITELADEKYIGTALSLQTGIGFLITIISIRLIPVIESFTGWEAAFSTLFIGPVFGIISLFKLRKESDSVKIAGGLK